MSILDVVLSDEHMITGMIAMTELEKLRPQTKLLQTHPLKGPWLEACRAQGAHFDWDVTFRAIVDECATPQATDMGTLTLQHGVLTMRWNSPDGVSTKPTQLLQQLDGRPVGEVLAELTERSIVPEHEASLDDTLVRRFSADSFTSQEMFALYTTFVADDGPSKEVPLSTWGASLESVEHMPPIYAPVLLSMSHAAQVDAVVSGMYRHVDGLLEVFGSSETHFVYGRRQLQLEPPAKKSWWRWV